ncbi:hypothetical protein CAPTEDRAFT_164179 [Capitella teleta]|uniref:Cytochrome P450 n=1 Tax=Capitella teleta TaxID=283909 RepID=R7UNS7_CAPTE|nr:hypothetical protein CAPTEDRAFT_164179 [Capitella teleta]|eukprot:ELU05557.1 hypothetical protein CAPTEDRAFT_164179 [Capitella teleta]
MLLVLWLKDARHGLNMPPGPLQWPVVGSLPSFALIGGKNPLAYLKSLGDKYGGIFSMKLGDHFAVFISDYHIIKEALVKQGSCFSTRPPTAMDAAIRGSSQTRHGVVFTNGRVWQVFRRFAMQSMRDFGVGKKSIEGKLQIEASSLIQQLEKMEGKPYNPNPDTQVAVTNIICAIIFGERYEYGDADFSKIMDSMRDLAQSVQFTDLRSMFGVLSLLPHRENFKRLIAADNHLKTVVKRQIEEHRRTLDDVEDRDIIDLCLRKQAGDGEDATLFNDEQLSHFIADLFLAGAETTATTLGWAYLYMAEHPEIQEKCFQEIYNVLGDRPPTMADRSKLPFVEATISEVQRIRTIAPLSVLHTTTQDATLRGYSIPKGTWVFPMLYAVSADEKQWKQPADFNPERFLDASGDYAKRESLIPFSVGPRMCAGEMLAKMELFIFFTMLLQNFRFSKNSPDQKIDLDPILGITWSAKPQTIQLTRR